MDSSLLISPLGVSVVICGYNSASRLPATLQHLFQQKVDPQVPWEIIVVNNASKDNTGRVAQDIYDASGATVPFQIVFEQKPGLNYAREAGLHAARYEYLLWVDDDNWLVPDYVDQVFRLMTAHPEVGMLGGRGLPALEGSPPAWFEQFKVCYALGDQAPASGEVPANGYVYGAGATIRKSAWLKIIQNGFESILTDRKGTSLASGGDVELGDTLRLAGYKLWYDRRLQFQHFISKDRLTWQYILRLAKGTGQSGLSAAIYYFVNRYPDLKPGKFKYLYLKRIVWLFLQVVKSPTDLFYYFFDRHNPARSATFEVTRNLALLASSIRQTPLAFKAFGNIMTLKHQIQGKAAV